MLRRLLFIRLDSIACKTDDFLIKHLVLPECPWRHARVFFEESTES